MTYSNREPFYWLNRDSRLFLERGYLLPGTTAEERISFIAKTAEERLEMPGFADKFIDYMSKGYYSLSSPIWSNYGLSRGLPISCFGSVPDDNMESIAYTSAENIMMSKIGGGTSAYLGLLRPRGSVISNNGISDGSFNFVKLFETNSDVVSQGQSRRGMFAGYIDIEHDDVHEWLNIKKEGNPIQSIFYGVSVGNDWMQQMIDGDVAKRELWAKVLDARKKVGIPYIFFRDNANNAKPEVYKDRPILASNLCTEIMLPSSVEESFVCCLSSMNVVHFEEWKNTDAVETLTMFLDTVIQEFIDKAITIPFMERAVKFAENHRAIGLGVLGWHDYLQQKEIPFVSLEATYETNTVFKFLQEKTLEASKTMKKLFGSPTGFPSLDRRNTTLMSIAPTKSSSFILGQVSPGIEPHNSNIFPKDLAKVKTIHKNASLEKVLEKHGMNTDEVWDSIIAQNGSVQHLDFLTRNEKLVYLTFLEMDQAGIVRLAAQRQRYIDQGQSLNLKFGKETSIKDINAVHIAAWDQGIKSLYYQFNVNSAQELSRSLVNCSSCEG